MLIDEENLGQTSSLTSQKKDLILIFILSMLLVFFVFAALVDFDNCISF